jgi:AcrR family transcriptional regulator
MARPRNPAHRDDLLTAATHVFATEGLGASTASIAKAAGVSTGTLFVYFDTKTTLVNELYVELKSEMGTVASAAMPTDAEPRDQLRHLWDAWAGWALTAPEKRRALAVLTVADDLTDESRSAVHVAYTDIAALLEQLMADGPLRDASLGFVTTLLGAIADATLDDLIAHPATSGSPDNRTRLAFDALWRALAGTDSLTPPEIS